MSYALARALTRPWLADPVAGRAGLVGTQNIRNNQSRVGGLDYVVAGGAVIEAVDSQPWSGEANVHVSIVNWIKTTDAAVLPKSRRLWFRAEEDNVIRRKRGSGSAAKQYDLNYREVKFINAALSDAVDVSGAAALRCNTEPQRVFQGVTPGHDGFLLSAEAKQEILTRQPNCSEVIHPYLGGDEVLSGNAIPTRFLIDFGQLTLLQAQVYGPAFRRIERLVLPDRMATVEKGKDSAGEIRSDHRQLVDRWWHLWRARPDMMSVIGRLPRYLVCSRVTKRPIFAFLDASIRPGDALQVFAFADDYSFGILQSNAHWTWFVAKCSKLTERFRYTPESVFDTFPWPQTPTDAQVDAVANAGRAIRAIRTTALASTKGGLRAIYRTLDLPGANPLRDAHMALDDAVRSAYGFSKRADLLADLLALNRSVAGTFNLSGEPVGPGVPPSYPQPERLVTTDCLGI